MNDPPCIRESVQDDLGAIEALYPHAFPAEELVPLVQELLRDTHNVISLVATIGSQIAGHAVITRCNITGAEISAALLGPLAVAPARQGRGIGSAIVLAGLHKAEESGVHIVCVLGDPNFYGRLGFVPESSIEPPYPLPPEWHNAWQSQRTMLATTAIAGRLLVPRQWMNPSLWAP